MSDDRKNDGLERAYGDAPAGIQRKQTGDPDAPPAAATDTLGKLMASEADSRSKQAEQARADDDDRPNNGEEERRRRAYAIWEREGRPEGRHEDHWRAAGDDGPPAAGTAPWTEGP